MDWHDLVIAVGGFIMILSMIPSLMNKNTRYPAYGSAVLTAVLAVYAFTFFDWGAILTTITVSGQCACWGFALLKRRLKSTPLQAPEKECHCPMCVDGFACCQTDMPHRCMSPQMKERK